MDILHTTVELGSKELFGCPKIFQDPYPYEVNGKLVTGYGSLIPICSLSNRSLLPPILTQQLFLPSSVKTSGRYFQSFETFLKSLTLCNNKSHQKFRNYFTPMYLLSLVSRSKWRKRIQAVVKKLKPWPPRSVIRGSRVVKRGPAYYRTNSFSLTLEFRS